MTEKPIGRTVLKLEGSMYIIEIWTPCFCCELLFENSFQHLAKLMKSEKNMLRH